MAVKSPLAPLVQYLMLATAIGVSLWIIIGGHRPWNRRRHWMEAINKSNARSVTAFLGRPRHSMSMMTNTLGRYLCRPLRGLGARRVRQYFHSAGGWSITSKWSGKTSGGWLRASAITVRRGRSFVPRAATARKKMMPFLHPDRSDDLFIWRFHGDWNWWFGARRRRPFSAWAVHRAGAGKFDRARKSFADNRLQSDFPAKSARNSQSEWRRSCSAPPPAGGHTGRVRLLDQSR